ncbi:MAG: hypothetical protein V4722_17970 [Bacteroidota bacterium]
MPTFPPRSEPIRKEEQLSQKREELSHAIKCSFPPERLSKAVEKYRAAELSLLKAKIHVLKDKDFQNRTHNLNLDSIENKITTWKNKTEGEIILEFSATFSK